MSKLSDPETKEPKAGRRIRTTIAAVPLSSDFSIRTLSVVLISSRPVGMSDFSHAIRLEANSGRKRFASLGPEELDALCNALQKGKKALVDAQSGEETEWMKNQRLQVPWIGGKAS